MEAYKPLSEKVAFADFETEGLGGKFIYGGLVDCRSDSVLFYDSINHFFDIVLDLERIEKDEDGNEKIFRESSNYTQVYFHNLEYDGHYLLQWLIEHKISFDVVNRVNRLMVIKVGKFKFIDSYALLMDSLKNLSKVFTPEYQKKQNNLDERNFDPNNTTDIEYLVYDCLALKYVVIRCRKLIYETFNVNAKYTTSSTALQAWRTTLKHDLFRLSLDKEEFVRKSYSGGLVYVSKIDVFRDISIYDFNSMYPSVMRDNLYPVGKPYWVTKFSGVGFYECEVDARFAKFLFLNGYVNDKKIARTSGKFKAYITDTEYQLAFELGYRLKIVKGLCFGEYDYLFREFVNRCERLRLQHGRDSVGTIVKYIQNSLYGKFGTKTTREKISYSSDILKGRTPYIHPTTGDFTGLYVDEIETDEPYMLPHLASYTTALARCKLVRAIIGAGINTVIYCDTDSLFVRESGKSFLEKIVGDTYGKIKLEEQLDYVVIVAPKMYFGVKQRAKGFPKRIIEQLERDLFENKLSVVGKEMRVEAKFAGMNSCRSFLKQGSEFGKQMHRSIPALNKEILEKVKEIQREIKQAT